MYTAEGRLAGCFVYFLVCQDSEPIYVKIGITATPDARLRALVNNCPVKAQRFATMRFWSREKAQSIENLLHEKFKKHRAAGEWFKFDITHKEEFNTEVKKVIAEHSLPNWPIVLEQMPVQPFMELAKAKQRFSLKKIRVVIFDVPKQRSDIYAQDLQYGFRAGVHGRSAGRAVEVRRNGPAGCLRGKLQRQREC